MCYKNTRKGFQKEKFCVIRTHVKDFKKRNFVLYELLINTPY
jgi:hypothetical protein